jgi:RimJ/RimL family protein N-acetyltransferase
MDLPWTAPLTTPADPLSDGMVVLRLPADTDCAAVCAYGQDPDVEETGWLPVPVPCSPAVAAGIIQEFKRGWQGRFGLTLIITTPLDGALCGVLHLSVRAPGVGEVAYGVAPSSRGRGLASRAVTLVAAWAFAHLGLTRLEIVVTAAGVHAMASRRVAEKAGFVNVGTRRSHVDATGLDYEDPLYVLTAPGSARVEAAPRL